MGLPEPFEGYSLGHAFEDVPGGNSGLDGFGFGNLVETRRAGRAGAAACRTTLSSGSLTSRSLYQSHTERLLTPVT